MNFNSLGAVLAIVAILIGVLLALGIAPVNGVVVGIAIVLLGIARLT